MMTMRRRKRKDENAEIITLLRTMLERLDRIEEEVKRTCECGKSESSPAEIVDRANIKASIT